MSGLWWRVYPVCVLEGAGQLLLVKAGAERARLDRDGLLLVFRIRDVVLVAADL